eukprot:9396752-Pyramimonas_sp.AAC.1
MASPTSTSGWGTAGAATAGAAAELPPSRRDLARSYCCACRPCPDIALRSGAGRSCLLTLLSLIV